jgi:hypothetical protein
MLSSLLMSALALPHLFCGWGNAIPASQFTVTISIPATAPSVGADYGWEMAEINGTTFTQVGFVWFATSTGYVVNSEPVPTGQPYLFAYTTDGQCNGNNLGQCGTYTLGAALQPGSNLTVDITHSGDWYGTEAMLNATWQMVAQTNLTGTPVWQTYSETWGPMVPITFSNIQYYDNGWFSLPGGNTNAIAPISN